MLIFVFCKQKTAYEMRISDWSSDVCSSDLLVYIPAQQIPQAYLQDMDELDKRKVVGFNVGTSLIRTMMPDDKAAYRAAVAATTGRLVAFDPRTGKVAWAVDYPADRKSTRLNSNH